MYLGRLLHATAAKLLLTVLLTLLLTALLGCGQKGALYLPQDYDSVHNNEPGEAKLSQQLPDAGHSAPTIKPNNLLRSKYQA